MADDETPDAPDHPQADLYSIDDDGNKTDVWIMEELLGDDDVPEGDYAHVVGEEAE